MHSFSVERYVSIVFSFITCHLDLGCPIELERRARQARVLEDEVGDVPCSLHDGFIRRKRGLDPNPLSFRSFVL